jgi:ribosomal protein S20
MIAANEKRLNALPAQIVEEQKAQISKVKTFQRQAQEALSSGDAEGAKTLATKAKLLLDDLSK